MSSGSPIVRDSFYCSSGVFSVITSAGTIHPRQTAVELKAHFLKGLLASSSSTGIKDQPTHWYEAQLLHYGMPVSRVKGTARHRLMAAVLGNPAGLAVPTHIENLEKEMKAEWGVQQNRKTADETASREKRKSTDDGISIRETATKKIRAAEKNEPDGNQNSIEGHLDGTRVLLESGIKTANRHGQTPSHTTNRGNTGHEGSHGSSQTFYDRASVPNRNCIPHAGQTTVTFSPVPSPSQTYHEPPPPYPGSPQGYDALNTYNELLRSSQGQRRLPPLGVINGRYKIDNLEIPEDGDVSFGTGEKSMICSIDGDAMWITFELGFVNGIMYAPERPRQSSLSPVEFEWCGISRLRGQAYSSHYGCSMAFIGDGFIEATLYWEGRGWGFRARRCDQQPPWSDRTAKALQNRWNHYCLGGLFMIPESTS